MAEQRRGEKQRQQAVAELLAVGDRLDEVRLSGAALQVLLELLGRASAQFGPDLAGASAALVDAQVVLWVLPHAGATTVRTHAGDLSVEGFRMVVTAAGVQPRDRVEQVAE